METRDAVHAVTADDREMHHPHPALAIFLDQRQPSAALGVVRPSAIDLGEDAHDARGAFDDLLARVVDRFGPGVVGRTRDGRPALCGIGRPPARPQLRYARGRETGRDRICPAPPADFPAAPSRCSRFLELLHQDPETFSRPGTAHDAAGNVDLATDVTTIPDDQVRSATE